MRLDSRQRTTAVGEIARSQACLNTDSPLDDLCLLWFSCSFTSCATTAKLRGLDVLHDVSAQQCSAAHPKLDDCLSDHL